MLGKHNTMYSVSITVAPSFQSSGIGRKLKEHQLRDALTRKKPDGSPRYLYVTGRNRVGRTAQMTHLNRVFGAHVVSVLTGQYEDPEGQAIYYRIPLGALVPDPVVKRDVLKRREDRKHGDDDGPDFDLASGRKLVDLLAEAPLAPDARLYREAFVLTRFDLGREIEASDDYLRNQRWMSTGLGAKDKGMMLFLSRFMAEQLLGLLEATEGRVNRPHLLDVLDRTERLFFSRGPTP